MQGLVAARVSLTHGGHRAGARSRRQSVSLRLNPSVSSQFNPPCSRSLGDSPEPEGRTVASAQTVGSAMLSTWAWKLDKDAPAWGQSRCKRKFLQLEAHMLRWSRTSPLGKDARSVDLRKAEWLSRSKCPGAPDDAIDFNISGRT